MIAGIVIAFCAAACFELGYVAQALEVRRTGGGHSLEPTLLGRLLRRPRWLAATALAGVGALLQVWALTLAPIAIVQPVLALGLVLLLVLSRVVLHERIARRDVLGAATIVAGVVLVAICAPPEPTRAPGGLGATLLLGLLGALAVLPFVLRARLKDARVRVVAATAGDAFAAIALLFVADAIAAGEWAGVIAWAAGAFGVGALALTAEMSALQQIAATRVAPVVLAGQVLVPVLAGPLVLGESWKGTPLDGGLLAFAVLVVTAGAAWLGASPAVADVIAGERQHDVGGDGQRGERRDR